MTIDLRPPRSGRAYPEPMPQPRPNERRSKFVLLAAIVLTFLVILVTALLLVNASEPEEPTDSLTPTERSICNAYALNAGQARNPDDAAFFVDRYHELGC